MCAEDWSTRVNKTEAFPNHLSILTITHDPKFDLEFTTHTLNLPMLKNKKFFEADLSLSKNIVTSNIIDGSKRSFLLQKLFSEKISIGT